ncbi:hypothetical protein SB359474_2505 [Shigella boydii 3594-74]|uniref:Uncharacterized protein n=1 Tax=Shigella flexneri CCH060 TaxID=754091 RepID=A0A6N3QYU5_SHIFL|nr:hypothetical protein SB359474_2505 [Shigella boydii 3594-74]EIQ09936.1 hypothetical protein SFCCH060_2536 [Shigella flexneri CCH060]EJZ65518.1 hypothetical protein SF148580_2569 [Shigella flexneri 1485-80]
MKRSSNTKVISSRADYFLPFLLFPFCASRHKFLAFVIQAFNRIL